MPRNVDEDHKHFIDIISGRIRKELKKYFRTNRFISMRGKNGKMSIPVPQIDEPRFTYGNSDGGLGRGPGNKGDVVKKDPEEGEGGPGDEAGDGMLVNIDMEWVLQFMAEELQLPTLLPKPSQTYEDIKVKYTNIALVGPESLRHNRRTMLQALKRMSASGQAEKLHLIPGFADPVKLITPINTDRRYRQYREIRTPSSKAVIMFGRDGSGSMDQYKCDIVSDMSWWIDVWIRRFYEKVERCYFWHDTVAQEVDEEKFYKYRYGGGTYCSTCPELMAEQFENRYPPDRWNIYCFYFTDGENWDSDNSKFIEVLKNKFPPDVCNLFGITQIMASNYGDSLKKFVDENSQGLRNISTVSIGDSSPMAEGERNEAIKQAIKKHLGKKEQESSIGGGI